MKNDSIALLSHFDYFPNSFIMTFGTISLVFTLQNLILLKLGSASSVVVFKWAFWPTHYLTEVTYGRILLL